MDSRRDSTSRRTLRPLHSAPLGMAGTRLKRMWGWLAAGIATALLAPAAASANNITVDSTADPTAAGCTLHDAITAANTNAVVAGSSCLAGSGTDTIDFNLPNPSTITLAGALPDITTDMNIVGPGAGQLTIDGTDLYRPFHVLSGHTDSISGVMLTNGFCPAACNGAQGGAIFNAGTLTLTGV